MADDAAGFRPINATGKRLPRPRSSSKINRTLVGAGSDIDEMSLMSEMDRGKTAAQESRYVFEVAWEVANKGEHIYR